MNLPFLETHLGKTVLSTTTNYFLKKRKAGAKRKRPQTHYGLRNLFVNEPRDDLTLSAYGAFMRGHLCVNIAQIPKPKAAIDGKLERVKLCQKSRDG